MQKSAFWDFIRLVVEGDTDQVARCLKANPALAKEPSPVGATRQGAEKFFFTEISHYLYVGDTALHMAAAAFSRPMAKLLISHGADCLAKNRRGAEPLHYAADANRSQPRAQADVIKYLISIGADPDAEDKSGVGPLHRAIRTRSLSAVQALLDGGANLRRPNKSGSTPLHLAVQNTGRGGSGSDEARRQQAGIIKLLLKRGARPTDRDARGKTVYEAATSDWIRGLLSERKSSS
jgi:ankyrin repeat protein